MQYYLFSRFHPIFHECHSSRITIIFLSPHISYRFWNGWWHSTFETTFNCIHHWGYIRLPLQLFDKIRITFTGLCSLKSSTCFVMNRYNMQYLTWLQSSQFCEFLIRCVLPDKSKYLIKEWLSLLSMWLLHDVKDQKPCCFFWKYSIFKFMRSKKALSIF